MATLATTTGTTGFFTVVVLGGVFLVGFGVVATGAGAFVVVPSVTTGVEVFFWDFVYTYNPAHEAPIITEIENNRANSRNFEPKIFLNFPFCNLLIFVFTALILFYHQIKTPTSLRSDFLLAEHTGLVRFRRLCSHQILIIRLVLTAYYHN